MFRKLGLAAVAFMAIFFGILPSAQAAPLTSSSDAAAHAAARSFLQSAEALYEATLKGNLPEARRLLLQAEARFRAIPMESIATAEGVEAMARSITRMKRTVASAKLNIDDWREKAAEIRLAADALAHPQAPVWHQYRAILLDDVRRLEEALGTSGNPALAKERLAELRGHYGRVRTAALLRAEPYVIERADSVLVYAERVLTAKQANPELLSGLAESLRDAMAGLFPGQRETAGTLTEPAPSPPWGWTAFMGTFIVAVLSWVGWLRYRSPSPVTPRGSLPRERRARRL